MGRASTFTGAGGGGEAGLLWQVLHVLFSLFYPICFSGVGVFQVKYDGQLRTNEDELACDLHCLRVQKNNSGKNGSTDWRFPRSLASCGVENQRRCFWPRGTLSCGYLDPIGWWRRRHLWNAGGEANTNLMYDDASRCSTLLWVSTTRSIDSGWTEVFRVWFKNVSQNYFPLSSTYVNRQQDDENQSSEPALYVKHGTKISYLRWISFQYLFDRSSQVCQHSTGLWSWPCKPNQTMKLSSKTNIRWWHRINAGLPKTVDDGRSQCKWSIDNIIFPRWLFSKCWSIFRRRRRSRCRKPSLNGRKTQLHGTPGRLNKTSQNQRWITFTFSDLSSLKLLQALIICQLSSSFSSMLTSPRRSWRTQVAFKHETP